MKQRLCRKCGKPIRKHRKRHWVISILRRQYYDEPKCKAFYQGFDIFFVKYRGYGVGWFTDCGEMFFYIYLGKHAVRFSTAGFMAY